MGEDCILRKQCVVIFSYTMSNHPRVHQERGVENKIVFSYHSSLHINCARVNFIQYLKILGRDV